MLEYAVLPAWAQVNQSEKHLENAMKINLASAVAHEKCKLLQEAHFVRAEIFKDHIKNESNRVCIKSAVQLLMREERVLQVPC